MNTYPNTIQANPGWFDDPYGNYRVVRWWDGHQWTSHTHLKTQVPFPTPYQPRQTPQRSVGVAYALWFFLGVFGAHRFYIGHFGLGMVYLFTFGLMGVGVLIDLFILASRVEQVNRANGYVAVAQYVQPTR